MADQVRNNMAEQTQPTKPSYEMWLIALGYEMAKQECTVKLNKFEPMFKEVYETNLSPERAVAFFSIQELIVNSGV